VETHALLFLAAIVAGTVNTVAGGGGLLTFPLLMAVVTPVTADATSAVALFPGYVTGTWACRKQLAPVRHWFWLLLGPSLLGGLLGALLLARSGNRAFLALIPWLILLATVVTWLRPLLAPPTRSPSPSPEGLPAALPAPSLALQVAAGVLQFVVAIYGGYFGAGIGILVIGTLGLIGLTDIHSVLALKNALSLGLRGVAVTVFIVERKVAWEYGAAMAAGGLLGGYLGGTMVRWTNRRLVRAGVIALGFGVAACYFWKIYRSDIPAIGGD
jgi:uncharacterized membrane protein YfcA